MRLEQPPTMKEVPAMTQEKTTTSAPSTTTVPVDSVPKETTTTHMIRRVDSISTIVKEKCQVSEVAPRDIFLKPDTPLAVHEIAAILRFGTSYGLIDWLAKRLQFAS